jgi:hypothetical protein
MIDFQIKYSLEKFYFRGLKLLDKSYQIYQIRSLYTVWNISKITSEIVLRLKLG